MGKKTIRGLIFFFLAVIAAFIFLIVLNDAGGRKPAAVRASASAMAQSALASAHYSSFQSDTLPMRAAHTFSSSGVRAEGAIMIVKEGLFQGVAEPPKNAMDMLGEMSGANSGKTQPVAFKAGDFAKKIGPIGAPPKGPALAGSAVPGLGKVTESEITMIKAPVDYKFFTSSETWAAFAGSHKCDPVKADFSKDKVLILVSLSDLPSGIFKITAQEKGKKELVLRYKVDPLAMSVLNEAGTQQAYSAAVVPRTADKVRLEQVP
jgi:hypothetical protein